MMRNRLLVRGFALLATVTLAPLPAAAQGKASTPARTSDGKPNLEGIYSFSTITPLQRPDALAGKTTLNERRPRRSKRRKTRGSIGICSTRSKGNQARDTHPELKAACCPTTSSGTNAATG